jgi:uncharacterized membrane protein YjjP (DUF1212 family)
MTIHQSAALAGPTVHDAIPFLLTLARALHAHGYPAHRLEVVLSELAARLGLEAQFFSTPTSLFAAFGAEAEQRTHLLRVEPGSVHMERLDALIEVASRVRSGERGPAEAMADIQALLSRPPRWGRPLRLGAAALSSACAAAFLGGGAPEAALAFGTGFLVAVLAELLEPRVGARRLLTPLAGFLAALLAGAVGAAVHPISAPVAILAGLIALVPGLTLTVATSELSAGHLVSGTSRMTGAVIQFLAIVVGVAVGLEAAARLFGALPPSVVVPLPGGAEWVALLLAPPALAVVLRAAPANLGWILLIAVAGFLGGRGGAALLGPELGLLFGALTAGLTNGLLARLRANHGAANMVPALILLVPGSVGFRSLTELLDRNVVSGIDLAFRTALMAASLSAGVVLANVLTPPRRLLRGRSDRGDFTGGGEPL